MSNIVKMGFSLGITFILSHLFVHRLHQLLQKLQLNQHLKEQQIGVFQKLQVFQMLSWRQILIMPVAKA